MVVRRELNYSSPVWILPAPGPTAWSPHGHRICRRCLSWWKQAPATLMTCCFINCSWSIHTRRFRTFWIVSVPTVTMTSWCNLTRLCLEPTQITSVLSAFSCNRWDEHHVEKSAVQWDIRWRVSTLCKCGWQQAYNCVSSAYKCTFTLCCLIVSTPFSV